MNRHVVSLIAAGLIATQAQANVKWGDTQVELARRTKLLDEACHSKTRVVYDKKSFDTVLARKFVDEYKSPVSDDPMSYCGVVLDGIVLACNNSKLSDDADTEILPALSKLTEITCVMGAPDQTDKTPFGYTLTRTGDVLRAEVPVFTNPRKKTFDGGFGTQRATFSAESLVYGWIYENTPSETPGGPNDRTLAEKALWRDEQREVKLLADQLAENCKGNKIAVKFDKASFAIRSLVIDHNVRPYNACSLDDVFRDLQRSCAKHELALTEIDCTLQPNFKGVQGTGVQLTKTGATLRIKVGLSGTNVDQYISPWLENNF